ncbi:MAG: ABC transporter substrate-binding protein [Lachnospiraceae bacterium]|nr:ABC transporter substrate-binding protein [Lachnospiraceae bacterium]
MKKKLFNVVLAGLLCAILGGCGDGSNNTNESEGKKEIVVGIQQDLDSLDPHLATAAGTKEVLFNIFEGLVKVNENGELVEAVASDYKISEDGSKYTFTIRDNVKFHNGETVTAEDVKYSIEKNAGLLEGSELLVSAFSIIDSVNILDSSTVEVVLSEPDTELISYMTVAIVPKDYTEQNTSPVGTGPFKFASYTPAESFVMEKNTDYWGTAPYLSKVTFKIVTNAASAVVELQAGSIDIYPYLTMDQADQLGNDFDILYGNTNLVQGLYLNNEFEPFDNVKVRQALYYAVDRQEILDIVAGGHGTIVGSFMYPGYGRYYNDLSDKYSKNIEKAKALLDEAGYENGFEFTVKVPANYQVHMDTALVIKDQLKEIGVTMNIDGIEWTSWLTDVYNNREFEATIIGFDSNLAPKDIMRRYVSDNSRNMCNFNNAEYDELYESAIATTDDAVKIKEYQRMQEILADEAASIFIADPATLVAVSKKLTGYTFYPIYVQDMSKVKFVSE